MNALERLGIQKVEDKDKQFTQALFYFLREFHFNPLDEYDGRGNLIKKGIPIPLFSVMLEELQEHNKKENAQMKKANRR